jgi:hypothetical protein
MNSSSNLLVLDATGQVGKLVAKNLRRGSALRTRGNAALNANMTREITRGRRHRVPRTLPWNLETLKWLRFASASGITLGAGSLALFLRYFNVLTRLPDRLRRCIPGFMFPDKSSDACFS